MKKIEKTRIPAALREVWDWKEAVFRETEKLSTAGALKRIHEEAAAARKKFGLSEAEPKVACVAEELGEKYKTRLEDGDRKATD